MVKNTAVLSLMAFIFFDFFCPVLLAEKISVDRDELEKILQRQNVLEKEIRKLKEQLKKTDEISAPNAEEIEYLKEDIEDMSERLDTVEKKSIIDKIRLGGEFRTEMHYYKYDDILGDDGQKRDGRTDELWSGRLRLNLRSEITNDIIFQGRLTYYKFWGGTNYAGQDYTRHRSPSDLSYSSEPDSEGNLHVERAYIDYFVPDTPLSITIGRMPTGDGPPYGLKNNTTRKATWPMLCHNGELDGIMTNLSLDEWTGLKTSFLRLGYYKISQNYQQYKGLETDPYRVGTAAFETVIPGVRDSMLWISADRSSDFSIFYEHPAASYHPPDYGSFDKYNVHVQFNNIKNSGFSCFGSFVYQDIRPRAQGLVIPREAIPPEQWPFPFDYKMGLLGNNIPDASGEISLGKPRKGYGYYAGVNYKFPFESLKYPQIGIEYNHGSKYYMGAPSAGGDDFLNKLSVNGDVWEVYYIQPVDEKHMYCRIGVIYADQNYIMWYLGPPEESDITLTDIYFLVNARF